MKDETMDQKLYSEFCKKTDELIKFLNDNFHPHVQIIIGTDRAELVEGLCGYNTGKHIKD